MHTCAEMTGINQLVTADSLKQSEENWSPQVDHHYCLNFMAYLIQRLKSCKNSDNPLFEMFQSIKRSPRGVVDKRYAL